jgi:hypothetical protein
MLGDNMNTSLMAASIAAFILRKSCCLIASLRYDTLRIIGESKILYLDYYGSGNETAIHLKQNKKITFMWCSFEKEPLILRVYGRGKILDKGTEVFTATLNEQFSGYDERIVRQIFEIDVLSVQKSCGWGVPFMNFDRDRTKLDDMSKKI